MKYVLIGCGRISPNHIKAAVENKLEIAAICDLVPEKMEHLRRQFGLPASVGHYTDYRQLLDEQKPELAAIATDSGSHAEIALACIRRGIHVIIEKPMAMSIADADKIVAAGIQHNVKISACHQNRFNIAVQKLRRALEGERFGKLSHGSVHVRWNRGRDYYIHDDWRGTWTRDGGTLMNQCIHGIDLLRWMMGDEIVEVYGVTRRQFHPYIQAEDVGMAVIQFKNGAVATVEGTVNVYPQSLEETLYIFGENGAVKLGGKSVNSVDVWQFADEKEQDTGNRGFEESTDNVYGNGHTSLYADVIEAVREDRPPYVDAAAGKRAVELILAIYKSQKEGRPVRLPLEDFAAAEMAGMFYGRG
ncbi:MAG: Gfo/Idh/MocA family oxidoreductase [Oscillospiraceae bacterium]|nr:Gfo/Idh/MocA family oxidoreductase [Oscillospiraceae bacterium]